MPSRAPIACHCGTLNCQKHTGKEESNEWDRWRKRVGNDAMVKLYKCKRWYMTRRQVLARDQVCVACNNALSTDCDHVIDARVWVSNGRDFYDQENLQGLCSPCHSKKTGAQTNY